MHKINEPKQLKHSYAHIKQAKTTKKMEQKTTEHENQKWNRDEDEKRNKKLNIVYYSILFESVDCIYIKISNDIIKIKAKSTSQRNRRQKNEEKQRAYS